MANERDFSPSTLSSAFVSIGLASEPFKNEIEMIRTVIVKALSDCGMLSCIFGC
ncbi:uncharacterized protein MELLADRAFT_54509 [Melampsora larici-populina 98AG31]|uniref:Uncharacterized protein n=1 Tax=Melampsora larici-populina (strain 98AG31 / pathotype 3-4-7) TaxID=747676 RepID=F4R4C7_MELLP|nr:uncharacterized protein MELLADRAFT_54509 [Melampsora larici-populina 98AG31]EGG12790.1 hypothetical protein MELLADRAFT_54509 [Melampsora larici-populina 98AG31]